MRPYWESKTLHKAALIIPILILLGILFKESGRTAIGTKAFNVPIEGFDPRDLLAGHFMTYSIRATRFEQVLNDAAAEGENKLCACFKDDEVVIYNCAKLACTHYVYIKTSNGLNFTTETLERYYFPEELKSVLATVPTNSTLRVLVGQGTARATQISVNDEGIDKTIEEWARERIADE
jgi:uncharacterized membrane-anchored protein